MEIKKVTFPKTDLILGVNYDRGDKFYFAHETDLLNPKSVLWPDLTWLEARFGKPLTSDSLNDGRKVEISNYKRCLELNCPMWELLNNVGPNGDFTYKNEKGETVKRYHYKLGEGGKELFQRHINDGLYVLCELVPEEGYEPVNIYND